MVQKDLEGREVISGECTSSRREGAGLDTGGLVRGERKKSFEDNNSQALPCQQWVSLISNLRSLV